MELLPQTAELMNLPTTHLHNANNLPALTTAQKATANVLRYLSLAGNPGFPIANIMLAEYSIFLSEHAPEITPAILKKVVDRMLTGKLPYDPNKGVRNIFENFESYKKSRIRFKIYDTDNDVEKEVNEDSELHLFDKSIWIAFDGGYSLSPETITAIRNFGFTLFDTDTMRNRKTYLENLEAAEPKPFVTWWQEFTAKREAHIKKIDAQEQERLERVNSEAERLKKELSDKLARKSIDW